LFRSRSVGGGILVGFLGGAVRVSTFVLSALYLQEVLKASPSVAGLAMIPTSVGGFIVSLLLLPRLLRTLGPERTLTVGLVLLAGGHFWLSRVPADIGYSVDVLPSLLVASAGVALSFMPSTMVIASGLAPEQGGLASGLATASSQIGAAIGVAGFTAVMSVGRNDSVEIGFQYAFVSSGTVAAAAGLIALILLRSSTLHREPEPQTLQAEAFKSDAEPLGRP
jgi:MFS family permease